MGKFHTRLFFFMFLFCFLLFIFPSCSVSPKNFPIIPFDEGYTPLFGDHNLIIHTNSKTVHLSLDESSGSGFASHDLYLHGYFSASIKLPYDYTAGVVVAFYLSNGDMYEKNHDEIDFEFLGNIRGKDWRVQTNVYGNGSTNIGREERYGLWFDPAEDFHQYSILWTDSKIIFYVDDVPIREIKRTESMKGDFPSKPMTLYATIWDASNWATNGGKYKVNYKYAPYVAEFTDFVLHGCSVNPIDHVTTNCDNTAQISDNVSFGVTPLEKIKMENFRLKHMTYSYCYDRIRYKVPLPECVINPQQDERLRKFDPVTFGNGRRHRRGKRHHRGQDNQAENAASF
ncbi:probable xyloglucan endotransglucosylase/hydrolase protein 28 [Cicer arietinum]|uniref:Xyloglucan endotransglucosylase/hydrolase n=1 Tax=Cicer arietinum TaxID=3827 RepID=A0A1S2Z1C9_CICAR|nr:probable xyloglucan endotransglucosylase/hydrolase protein 28 [Cicer arietinum]